MWLTYLLWYRLKKACQEYVEWTTEEQSSEVSQKNKKLPDDIINGVFYLDSQKVNLEETKG